jgi:penicillin amidase
MRIGSRWWNGSGFALRRTTAGVMEVGADDDVGLARGLGFAHAHDRQVQMMLLRLIGQGRLSECLRADAETESIDVFMRQVGFAHGLDDEVAALREDSRALVCAYCEGVNTYLESQRRPVEFILARYRPEPWRPEDTLLTVGVMSYVGLAQSQADIEKLIIQALRGGASLSGLQTLFAPHLDAVDDHLLELIGRVELVEGLVPESVRFASAIPKLVASNNWAVSPSRSRSGHALQCNDPHLDVSRLPAVWYEWIGRTKDDYRAGISMPGIPGLVMGRTRRVSAGFTYGFMDQVDYFIEEIRDGRRRTEDGWKDIAVRSELVHRKHADPLRLQIRELPSGTLEADPRKTLADGLYLSRAWSGRKGAAASIDALVDWLAAPDVQTAARALRGVSISCNWLLADRDGHIAYQQSGRMPRRQHSGLHPVPGWERQWAWNGMVDRAELVTIVDPPEGFLVTANEDRNRPGHPMAINMPMADYRARRVGDLLSEIPKLDLGDMKRIQSDLVSLQAERLLGMLDPYLPDTEAARLLRSWDRRYESGAVAPVVFETMYAELLREVFGRRLFGLPVWDALSNTTPIVADFYGVFDEALMGDDPLWFGDEGKPTVLRRVLQGCLGSVPRTGWGDARPLRMTNLFFAGTLPTWLGFDRSLVLPGSRATVVQGSVFFAHGRSTTFAPSWRYVTDLSHDVIHTALPGGPSGRRTSPYYVSDLARWEAFSYKRLVVLPPDESPSHTRAS